MIEAFQRPRVHLNMASIDKLSGDEVIEVCLSFVEIIRESSCPPQGLLQEGNGDGERGLRSRRSLAEEDERVDSACSGASSNQRI